MMPGCRRSSSACTRRELPRAVGAPIGHGDRNEAVPFGADAILDLEAGTLEITEAGVT